MSDDTSVYKLVDTAADGMELVSTYPKNPWWYLFDESTEFMEASDISECVDTGVIESGDPYVVIFTTDKKFAPYFDRMHDNNRMRYNLVSSSSSTMDVYCKISALMSGDEARLLEAKRCLKKVLLSATTRVALRDAVYLHFNNQNSWTSELLAGLSQDQPVRISALNTVVFQEDLDSVLDEYALFNTLNYREVEPRYIVTLDRMSTAVKKYMPQTDLVAMLETRVSETTMKFAVCTRTYRVLSDNSDCSGLLQTLLERTVPQVRQQLLGYVRDHVDTVQTTEQASKIVRDRMIAIDTGANRTYEDADDSVRDAELYQQQSQLGSVFDGAGLESIGKAFGQALKFDERLFRSSFLDANAKCRR
jgi:hypothetical protein